MKWEKPKLHSISDYQYAEGACVSGSFVGQSCKGGGIPAIDCSAGGNVSLPGPYGCKSGTRAHDCVNGSGAE